MNRAVFLDRDGTINVERHYLRNMKSLKLIKGSAEAIRLLNRHGFKVVVITNQAGIARGYVRERVVKRINKKLKRLLSKGGAKLDGVFYCPHHKDGVVKKYRLNCPNRKPSPGNIFRAAKLFNIDLKGSYFVGDMWSDIKAGANAGCKTILVLTGYGSKTLEKIKNKEIDIEPDFVAKDLLDAVYNIILNEK